MICPNCNHTIREERRYLMARDPDGELVWPDWAIRAAVALIAGLSLVVALAVTHG